MRYHDEPGSKPAQKPQPKAVRPKVMSAAPAQAPNKRGTRGGALILASIAGGLGLAAYFNFRTPLASAVPPKMPNEFNTTYATRIAPPMADRLGRKFVKLVPIKLGTPDSSAMPVGLPTQTVPLTLPDLKVPPAPIVDLKIPEVDPESLCRPLRLFRTVVEGKGKRKVTKKIPYTADLVDEDKFAMAVAREKADGTLEWIAGANATELRTPASMTKLLTAELIFEQLKAGHLKETDPVTFSDRARAMEPSNLASYRAKLGNTWVVRDVLKGMMMKSGNDAAVALGELISTDETRLGQVMTMKARSIGMRGVFKNASGWTDVQQQATAADMVMLMSFIYKNFPEYAHYLGTKTWQVNVAPKKPMMLANNIGHIQSGAIGPIKIDGAKSGTLDASGLNMIVSGTYAGRRVYIVVMGGEDRDGRNRCMQEIANRYVVRAAYPVAKRP